MLDKKINMTNQAPKAIVITPTYNERENIERTIDALQKNFAKVKNWQMHILVVDDSSPDKTYDLVKQLQKKHPNLHLLINKKKAGLGSAYLKGMHHAFDQLQADLIFEFDADLSHDPSKIPQFLQNIDQGYDMVLGSRYIRGGSIPDNWGFHRKVLSVLGNLTIRLILTNFSIADWTGGYRAITKKTFELIAPEMTDERFSGYTFQIGFLHKAVQRKLKITEVPFHFKDRVVGKSKIGPEFIINNLIYLFKVRAQEIMAHRVFKFLVVGTISAITQLATLQIWRQFLPYQIAYFTAVECAILVNFIINNAWTFADRKLKMIELPIKFVKFNLASAGSILIQQLLAFGAEKYFAIGSINNQTIFPVLLTLPIINYAIDLGLIVAVVGILIGMFWNYFAYNAFIWKKSKK